jgi:hypothetical protein
VPAALPSDRDGVPPPARDRSAPMAARRSAAFVVTGLGTLLLVGSMQIGWVTVRGGSARFPVPSNWIGGYLVGALCLAAIALAAVLSDGRIRRSIRVLGTLVASALAGFVAVAPTMEANEVIRQRGLSAEPGPGIVLALAMIATYVAGIWLPPHRARSGADDRARSWRVGLLLLIAGLGALLIAGYLPWWRTTYVDGVQTVGGAVAAGRVFPLWLPPVGAAVAALTTHGTAQRIARLVSAVLGSAVLVCCSGLTGVFWFFAGTGGIARERGMTGTSPDVGLVVAFASVLLIALAGAVARRDTAGPGTARAAR